MRDAEIGILRQLGVQYLECSIASHVGSVENMRVLGARIEEIDAHNAALAKGLLLPVGSVEFLRNAMRLSGIVEPDNLSYPDPLRTFLGRHTELREASRVSGHWFVKPATTKAFTGFVVDTHDNPDHLSAHDRIQYQAFLSLSPTAMVWVSHPVNFVSEVRYYICNGSILGAGRYDDGPDDSALPCEVKVQEMVAAMSRSPAAPIAYAIDVGVLETGETVLVEVNDAWALGYYKGTLSYKDYFVLLRERWSELLRLNAHARG